jgi:hypothetical protein
MQRRSDVGEEDVRRVPSVGGIRRVGHLSWAAWKLLPPPIRRCRRSHPEAVC